MRFRTIAGQGLRQTSGPRPVNDIAPHDIADRPALFSAPRFHTTNGSQRPFSKAAACQTFPHVVTWGCMLPPLRG